MEICKEAFAGTLESSDVLVEIFPLEDGIQVEVQSVVYNQFGQALEETVRDVLSRFDAGGVRVLLRDRGALECTVRARVETALKRACTGGE